MNEKVRCEVLSLAKFMPRSPNVLQVRLDYGCLNVQNDDCFKCTRLEVLAYSHIEMYFRYVWRA